MGNYLIVGGSSGIGSSICESLAEEGHNVYATFNSREKTSDRINFQKFNVLEDGKLDLPETLDGVVYCPGSIKLKPFQRLKKEDFLEDYQLQHIGAVNVIQQALPALKKSGEASVVVFSTVAVNRGFNFHSLVASSKGALEGLTKSLAAEFAPKIRFNAIAPSLTDTPLASSLLSSDDKRDANAKRHPMKRIGTPQDMASLATFLLGKSSSWITGQVIQVDGGITSINS
ncbi:SDR family oxidoreductase [bacterium]|nr:SDR family oxidoreductase [bacterium]